MPVFSWWIRWQIRRSLYKQIATGCVAEGLIWKKLLLKVPCTNESVSSEPCSPVVGGFTIELAIEDGVSDNGGREHGDESVDCIECSPPEKRLSSALDELRFKCPPGPCSARLNGFFDVVSGW